MMLKGWVPLVLLKLAVISLTFPQFPLRANYRYELKYLQFYLDKDVGPVIFTSANDIAWQPKKFADSWFSDSATVSECSMSTSRHLEHFPVFSPLPPHRILLFALTFSKPLNGPHGAG